MSVVRTLQLFTLLVGGGQSQLAACSVYNGKTNNRRGQLNRSISIQISVHWIELAVGLA